MDGRMRQEAQQEADALAQPAQGRRPAQANIRCWRGLKRMSFLWEVLRSSKWYDVVIRRLLWVEVREEDEGQSAGKGASSQSRLVETTVGLEWASLGMSTACQL